MPYSSSSGKKYITSFIERLVKNNPQRANMRALDLGAGSGTYAKMFKHLIPHWTGVEIWEPYVEQFGLNDIYDRLIIKPAQEAVEQLIYEDEGAYDVIFLGDMLEHMPKEDAIALLFVCGELVGTDGMVVTSVPNGEYPQDEYLGNPHEAHVATWTAQELKDVVRAHLGVANVYSTIDNEIAVCIAATNNAVKLMQPKVACYMITKNEAQFITRCISSLDDADEVVVCDTGSTDDTFIKLHELSISNPKLKLHDICVSPWRFDDARNASMSFISPDIDLCISIDADEVLEDEFIKHIKQVWWQSFAQGNPYNYINHKFETHWNWDKDEDPVVSQHFHERVHSRFGFRWVHPVHEKLVTHDTKCIGWCMQGLMKQMPDNSKSRSSYGPLLELAVKEDPADWKLWSFLSHERQAAGNTQGAIEALKACSAIEGHDVAFVNMRLSHLHEYLGNYRLALEAARSATYANPIREVFMYVAELAERHGDYVIAKHAYMQALEAKQETYGYMRRPEYWTEEFVLNIHKKLQLESI